MAREAQSTMGKAKMVSGATTSRRTMRPPWEKRGRGMRENWVREGRPVPTVRVAKAAARGCRRAVAAGRAAASSGSGSMWAEADSLAEEDELARVWVWVSVWWSELGEGRPDSGRLYLVS